MQAPSRHHDASSIPLGQRRVIPDLARFALDLTRARAVFESAASLRDYPSPPMSGSPPLPPKATQESAERSQGTYNQPTTQDVYRGIPTLQADMRLQPGPGGPSMSFAGEAPERMPYAFPPHSEAAVARPVPYPQHSQAVSQQQQYLPAPGQAPGPGSGSAPAPPVYPVSTRPPVQKTPLQTSPKLQRKTKGHVASACVPCKRAHLRCDAQRPCSRCISNGKEDVCVDVQHKKRGRPRLRDDREARYDPARFGSPHDTTSRRPTSLYGPPAPAVAMPPYDDGMRRSHSQSYRVLKSQPPEPIPPRYIERGSMADANVFPSSLSISTKPPEPTAFLTMDLEIANASTTFVDALARPNIKGLRLLDITVPSDRERVLSHQRQMQEEQKMRDPTYLPPIFGKQEEDRVIQALGFSSEEISRYQLDRHEYLTFQTADGQSRTFPVRMGLAKQDSIYFVVVSLNLAVRQFQPPTPSPNPRDIMYSYQALPQPYSQPTPVSATFDPRATHRGGTGYGQRQLEAPSPMMVGLSPGQPPSYAASPSRPDYATGQPSYQVPRSELPPATRPPQTPGYQLPPIRSQQQQQQQQQRQSAPPPPPDRSPQSREDRSRVDIGGLIDPTDPSRRPRP